MATMITVHDSELCSEFFNITDLKVRETGNLHAADGRTDVRKHSSSNSSNSPRGRRHHSPSRPSTGPTRTYSSVYRAKEWLTMKSRRNVVLLPPNPELESVEDQCKEIKDRENTLLQELNAFLDGEENESQRKKEMLYKQWSERVFDPIQSAITKNMKTRYPVMDVQKRALFDTYLKLTNHRDAFLETIDKGDYDPLSLPASPAKTQPLNDPLVAQYVDHTMEQQVIEGCNRGAVNCTLDSPGNGRQDTDPVTWLAMELVQIDSRTRERTRQRLTGQRHECNMAEDDGDIKVDRSGSSDIDSIPHKRSIEHAPDTLQLRWKAK